MSGYMRMTPGLQPQNIPWPEHSRSMAVESFVKRGGGMQKWEVHYFAPNLAVWFLAVPWVSHTPQPLTQARVHEESSILLSFTLMCNNPCSAALERHVAVAFPIGQGVVHLR